MRMSRIVLLVCLLWIQLFWVGCSHSQEDPEAGAPPPMKVEHLENTNVFSVEGADKFPLTVATEHRTSTELRVTGTVNPDVSRAIPVVTLATGRVIEIKARLGDEVQKGQLLLRVQSPDISGAFSDYQKAIADEKLAHTQLERSQLLYSKGAISLNDLQVAEDTEAKAQVDVKTTAEKLRVLGVPQIDAPSGVVDIRAPISGVITDQEITNAGGVQGLSSPNPFTISDLSWVWILCDVYENDLPIVRMGDTADIRLNAYPDRLFTGRISNIGPILDPNIRTAKVRIEVANPGMMRPGMFATATFHGRDQRTYAAVPATAILHLHDRNWVYVPAGGNQFRRVEVVAGDMITGGAQEIISGIAPGQQVVANALEFQNSVEQQ